MQNLMYRKGVVAVVRNKNGLFWIGKRAGLIDDFWQFPQGGIDDSEPPQSTILRELYEETGIHNATVTKQTNDWISYSFPNEIMKNAYNGKYQGQQHIWFLLDFYGSDEEINLHTSSHCEFREWKWASLDFLIPHVIGFKKQAYQEALQALGLVWSKHFSP